MLDDSFSNWSPAHGMEIALSRSNAEQWPQHCTSSLIWRNCFSGSKRTYPFFQAVWKKPDFLVHHIFSPGWNALAMNNPCDRMIVHKRQKAANSKIASPIFTIKNIIKKRQLFNNRLQPGHPGDVLPWDKVGGQPVHRSHLSLQLSGHYWPPLVRHLVLLFYRNLS